MWNQFNRILPLMVFFRSACLKYYTRAAKDVGVSVSQEGCKSEASLPIAYFMPR